MQRMGMVIGIHPEHVVEYRRLHAAVWPRVLERIALSKLRNYSIFLREPENLLFGYWEYHGDDFGADMAAIAADPDTQAWWALCGPCQRPLASRQAHEHWAPMEQVFHLD
jgi:L-rhamnose mutarotase